jgi:hypothetical protein
MPWSRALSKAPPLLHSLNHPIGQTPEINFPALYREFAAPTIAPEAPKSDLWREGPPELTFADRNSRCCRRQLAYRQLEPQPSSS